LYWVVCAVIEHVTTLAGSCIFPIRHPHCIFALFLQPARIQAVGLLPSTIYAGQNGTNVQFSTPEIQEDGLFSSRMVSVAVFGSTSSGTRLAMKGRPEQTTAV